MSFDGLGERLFSLHRRLPFARFLITNSITGTPGFSIIFPPSFPRLTYIAPRYLLDFCSRRHVKPFSVFLLTTMLFHVFKERIAIAFKDTLAGVIFLLIFHYFPITSSSYVCMFLFEWKMAVFLF